jgi:polar amino acid transport system substrate-binding protein
MKHLARLIGGAAWLAATLAFSTGAFAQTCEPDKVAQKYPAVAGKTLKIGVDAQTPPYVMRDPKDFNKLIGFDADIARAVLDCAGIKYEFFIGGWSGLLPAVISDQIQIFWNNLYYTAERAKQVDYVTYMQAGTGALSQAGNPKKLSGLADLCGTVVAVGVGTVEEPQVKKQSEDCKASSKSAIELMSFPDVAAGTRLVQSKRADVMLYDLALIDSLAKDNPKEFSNAFKILSGFAIGVAIKKGNEDLLKAISDGLTIMQTTGKQKEIFEKYTIDPSLTVKAEIKRS